MNVRPTKRTGSVFILALIVLTAATTILALTVAAQRVSFKSTVNRMESKRARLMAESAIQRAIAELAVDPQTNLVDQNQTWFTLGNKGEDQFMVGGESFRMQIVDAGAFLSLNSVTESQLLTLNMTQSQIDSLLDWREAGDTPRAQGAKDEYYNTLDRPYNARKGPLQTFDEVLLVKDWLPSTVYDVPSVGGTNSQLTVTQPLSQLFTVDSYSPNTNGSGQALQNINTVQAQQLVQAGLTQQVAQAVIARRNGLGRFESMNQVFSTPGLNNNSGAVLLDRFTAATGNRATGRVNLNTASEEVLSLLPGMTIDVAQAIVSRQTTGFATLGEIFQVPGVSLQLVTQFADQITVGGDTFLVRCEGRAGETRLCVESVVQIVNGAPQVVKTMETSETSMWQLWGWPEEPSSETVVSEDQRQ